jgi:transcriptional regulator with XRE-family HTH domain
MSSDLGARLYELRRLRDLSQADVAKRCDTTREFYSRIERGELTNPTINTLEKLAAALGTTVAVLIRP